MSDQFQAYAAAIGAMVEPLVADAGPGMVVAVALNGATVYRRGLGLASIEHGVPNSPETRMRIGSVSKQFTCLAALLLAEEGLLDVDAPIGRYLPELPARAGRASLRQLMWHTAGIRCHIDTALLCDGLAVRPQGEALRSLVRQGGNFEAGERMMYSNGGYHLLSLAMERVTKMALGAILEQRIFAPLGMDATALVPSDLDVHPDLATLYVPNGQGGYRRGIFPTEELLGEGGIVSTAGDMLRWMAHLRQPRRIGTPVSWEQMLQCPVFASGFKGEYALGLFIERHRGLETVNHAGNVLGGASHMLSVPAHGLDIFIMTNGAAADPIELAGRIVDTVLAGALGAEEPWARTADYAHVLGDYFAAGSGMVCSFEDMDGILGLSTCYDRPNPLIIRHGALELTFSRNSAGHFTAPLDCMQRSAGKVQALTLLDCGVPAALVRMPAQESTAQGQLPQLPELAGRYACAELGATAEVADDGHMLVKGSFGFNRLAMEAVAPDVLRLASIEPGVPRGGVLRVLRKGAAAGLELNLSRSRKLVFTRTPEAT